MACEKTLSVKLVISYAGQLLEISGNKEMTKITKMLRRQIRKSWQRLARAWVNAKLGMDGEANSVSRSAKDRKLDQEMFRWKRRQCWNVSSPQVERQGRSKKHLVKKEGRKNAEARPVSWRRSAKWTPVLHIASAPPSQVPLIMADINAEIKLKKLRNVMTNTVLKGQGHILPISWWYWTPKLACFNGSKFLGKDSVPNKSRFFG